MILSDFHPLKKLIDKDGKALRNIQAGIMKTYLRSSLY